jgi:hypothetical protein
LRSITIQDAKHSSHHQLHLASQLTAARLVPREENWCADLLSHHQVEKFLARTPGASRSATTPLSVPTLV